MGSTVALFHATQRCRKVPFPVTIEYVEMKPMEKDLAAKCCEFRWCVAVSNMFREILINLNFELVDHFETQEIISALVRKTVCIAVAQNQHVFRFISLRVRARIYHVT